jgi:HEAT repeat protein
MKSSDSGQFATPSGWARRRRRLGILIALLAVAGGWAWTKRDAFWAWYQVRQLMRAGEADRGAMADRVAALGEAAVPSLLDGLTSSDQAACGNVGAALEKLGAGWGANDARTAALAKRLGDAWPGFSSQGRTAALEAAAAWFRSSREASELGEDMQAALTALLNQAAEDGETHAAALDLCIAIGPRLGGVSEPARRIVRSCLCSPTAEVRLRSVQASTRPGLDTVEQVAALLDDPVVEVRRAAIPTLGAASDVVLDDALLKCLHDSDAEVRRLCEEALLGRGLSPDQIRLGRLFSHRDYLVRLSVLDELRRTPELVDRGLWLRRLSHDAMPSVRVAAARVMARQKDGNLTDRLEEMARNDPSPTVCELADYYLRQARTPTPR